MVPVFFPVLFPIGVFHEENDIEALIACSEFTRNIPPRNCPFYCLAKYGHPY